MDKAEVQQDDGSTPMSLASFDELGLEPLEHVDSSSTMTSVSEVDVDQQGQDSQKDIDKTTLDEIKHTKSESSMDVHHRQHHHIDEEELRKVRRFFVQMVPRRRDQVYHIVSEDEIDISDSGKESWGAWFKKKTLSSKTSSSVNNNSNSETNADDNDISNTDFFDVEFIHCVEKQAGSLFSVTENTVKSELGELFAPSTGSFKGITNVAVEGLPVGIRKSGHCFGLEFLAGQPLVAINEINTTGLDVSQVRALIALVLKRASFRLTFGRHPNMVSARLCTRYDVGRLARLCMFFLELHLDDHLECILTSFDIGVRYGNGVLEHIFSALLCLSQSPLFVTNIFSGKEREHVELICYLFCYCCGKAINPNDETKLVTLAEHDTLLGGQLDGEGGEQEIDPALLQHILHKCKDESLLYSMMGFMGRLVQMERVKISTQLMEEIPLQFACVLAPQLMDPADPPALLRLTEAYCRSNEHSDETKWDVLNILVPKFQQIIAMIENQDEFFYFHAPFELLRGDLSEWKVKSGQVVTISKEQIQEAAQWLCQQHVDKSKQPTSPRDSALWRQFSQKFPSFEKDQPTKVVGFGCIIGQIAIEMLEEPLITPYLFPDFILSAQVLQEQVHLNYILKRLLASIQPTPRRHALQNLCTMVNAIASMASNPHDHKRCKEWLIQRLLPRLLIPRITGQRHVVPVGKNNQIVQSILARIIDMTHYMFERIEHHSMDFQRINSILQMQQA